MCHYVNKFGARVAIAFVLINLLVFGETVVRWIDNAILHGTIKDTIGWVTSDEDWSSIPIQSIDFDRTWINYNERPFRIAHALGGSGTKNSNTFSAFEQSKKSGYTLFEVDISLTSDNKLLCLHDPKSITSADQSKRKTCEFNELLRLVDRTDIWLVLDIKTNFDSTATKILDVARSLNLTNILIYQLYKPSDFSWIQEASKNHRLPFPIVTTYMSKRSSNHILRETSILGLDIVTVPLVKLRSIRNKPTGTILMTHPVHTCEAVFFLSGVKEVQGYYTTNNLKSCN